MPEPQVMFLKAANGVSVPFLVVPDVNGNYQMAATLLDADGNQIAFTGAGEIKAIIDSAEVNVDGALTIADGADTAQGLTTDTAVVTDANGTVSGKLRGLVKIFADVWNSTSHWLKTQDQGTLPTNVSQAAAGVGLTGLLGAIWGWIAGATGFTSYAPTVTLSGSTVPDAQSLPAHIYDPVSGKIAGVDQYNNLKVALGTTLSALQDAVSAVLALGSPTAGTWISGPGAPTTTAGGSFLIAMDADATNPITNWQLVTVGAQSTGAGFASAAQTAIENLVGIYQSATVAYTNGAYVFTSGSQGLGSQVMIMSAPSNDIAATMLLTAAMGATYVNGGVGAPVSLSNPLPVIGSMNGPQGVQDYTIPLGSTLYIPANSDVAFGNLTINGTLANYGIVRCMSLTFGSGSSFIKGAASTTETGIV